MEGEHRGPFNLGNPGEFTMLELAEVCLLECILLSVKFLYILESIEAFQIHFPPNLQVVKETIDPSATVEYKPNTADDPQMRKLDISKAKELLNWEPKISLREGLPLMVSDFRNRILNENEGNGA
ncbi:hypothetical protein CRYUN_Cryun09bG0025000 [Craigia yunnanensis]